MSRGKRLLVLCLVLVLLVGTLSAVVILKKNETDEDSSSSYSASTYGVILENEENTLKSIAVKNKTDEYTLLLKKETKESSDESGEPEETLTWYIEGHEDWTLNSTSISNLVAIGTRLNASALVNEDAANVDLAEFGLKNPVATVTITLEDGTQKKVLFGDNTPDGIYYYGMVEGDPALYTLGSSPGNAATATLSSLRNVSSSSVSTEDELYYFFAQQKGERPIEIQYLGEIPETENWEYHMSYYMLKQPYDNPTMEVTGNISELFKAIGTITIVDQIEENCTDLDRYGVGDEPEYRLKMTTRTQLASDDSDAEPEYEYTTVDYYFGFTYGDDDSMIYFREGDSDEVFGIQKSFLDDVDFKPFTYIQKLVYLNNIDRVDVLKVTGDKGTYTLSIKREQVEETSDESDDSEDPLVAYRVNDTLTKEDLFKKAYQGVIGIMPDYEIYKEKPEYDETDAITFEFSFLDGTSYTVKYYKLSEFYYVTQIDEDTWFACNYDQFNTMWSALEACLTQDSES